MSLALSTPLFAPLTTLDVELGGTSDSKHCIRMKDLLPNKLPMTNLFSADNGKIALLLLRLKFLYKPPIAISVRSTLLFSSLIPFR